MKRANIKILALILALIVLPPLMWELKSQVGVVPGTGGIPNDAVQGAGNLTTTGAIPYVSASGTLSQDTPGIHWDATNNRLGLGTASPTNSLTIVAPDSGGITMTGAGSVGHIYSPGGGGAVLFNNSAATGFYWRQNSIDKVVFTAGGLNVYGTTGIGPSNTSPTGTLHVYDATASTGVTTLTIRAGAGQSTTNLQSWQNSSGTALATVSSTGGFQGANFVNSSGNIGIGSSSLVLGSAASIGFSSTTNWFGTADLGFTRSSANNLGITNGSSTTYWTLGAGGILAGTDNTYDIGASGANRPRNVFIAGYSLTTGVIYAGSSLNFGSGATSVINGSGTNGNIVISNAAGNDFGLLQFGGTTSSFPALKRSSTTLQVRLADDSADGTLQTGTLIVATQTPASAVASGTAGTIAWDSNYIYICTATNTWKRVAIATW